MTIGRPDSENGALLKGILLRNGRIFEGVFENGEGLARSFRAET
jgi:hypothetical protein